MTQGPSFPPPGAPVPEEPTPIAPPPGYVAPAGPPLPSYPGYVPGQPGRAEPGRAPLPGMLGAAHKPGAFPLRPLTLGNIYDGVFRIIRFNPKATVGAAVMVTAVAMVIPVVVTAILTWTVGVGLDASGEIEEDATTAEVIGVLGAYGSLLLGTIFAQIGTIYVTGMVVHVARAAAVGRRLSLGDAWAATRGKRWRLLGLSLVIGVTTLVWVALYLLAWVLVVVAFNDAWPVILVWGLVTVPAFLALSVWLWVRLFYLPVPALMLEQHGVFAALGRSWRLTRGGFWRTFGIALLSLVIAQFVGGVLSVPFSIAGLVAGAVFPGQYLFALMITQALATIAQNAFVAPFIAGVTSLQYVDQRMRKEAFDVELMREAGIAG